MQRTVLRLVQNLVVLSLIVAATSAHAQSEPRLKLLTYNVGLLRAPILGDLVADVELRSRETPEALGEFVKQKQPDVILLQEVWEKSHQLAFEAKLRSLGYQVALPVGIRGPVNLTNPLSIPDVGYKGSTGFVFAWNYRNVELKSEVRMDSYSQHNLLGSFDQGTGKGIVSARLMLRASGTPFFLVGAYSTALEVDPMTGFALETRDGQELLKANAGQMALVAHTAVNMNTSKDLVVVMGDLNVGPGVGEENFRALERALGTSSIMPKGASWSRENILVKTGRYPNDPTAMIDHIFVLDNSQLSFQAETAELAFTKPYPKYSADMVLLQESPLSDHYGVYVEGVLKGR